MEIRKATLEDMPEILRVFAAAREAMKRNNNPTQWGDDRPAPATLERDIHRKELYLEIEDGKVVGVFALNLGIDEAHEKLQGTWLNDRPYGVIHRLAGDGTVRGVLARCLEFCETVIDNIKIDTHKDNLIMQHLLGKYGFVHCGTILAEDGTPRLAYQRTAEKN